MAVEFLNCVADLGCRKGDDVGSSPGVGVSLQVNVGHDLRIAHETVTFSTIDRNQL